MITEAVIRVLAGGVRIILGLIPTWEPPPDAFESSAYEVGAMAGALNGHLPVAVAGVCLVLLLALKVFLLGWRALVFIYHQFWGSQ